MLTQSFVLAVSGLSTTGRTVKVTRWAWEVFRSYHAKLGPVCPSFFFVRRGEQNTQPRRSFECSNFYIYFALVFEK
jgi:hypothetical protein